jgi:hypothetical protein
MFGDLANWAIAGVGRCGDIRLWRGRIMRFSAGAVLNAVAWLLVAGLIGVAVVIAALFGAVGLILLGALTALVCVRADVAEESPTWGPDVFRAKMTEGGASPEQRAAMQSERQTRVGPLRYYRRCGMALIAIGAVIFLWQQWRG